MKQKKTIKKLSDYKIERGKPEASIVAEIELHLENYKISRASYCGGDYNGVCCRRLVEHVKPISEEVRTVLITKKDERHGKIIIHNKVDDLEQMLGLLEAFFTYLNIFYPNEEEQQNTMEAAAALSTF
jgi:hypothetical protein